MTRAIGTSPTTERQRHAAEVAAYVAAGGNEQVQRVVTAVHGLHRRLSQWYTKQLASIGLSAGEWAVISHLATVAEDHTSTPSQLAVSAAIAPSSMTHRLDRMSERGLIKREQDPANRTRILVSLTEPGWEMFQQVIRESDVVESDVLSHVPEDQRENLAALLELGIAGLDDALR
ncbi:MarR family winged helix-turn-helix transcriptional regulator [Rudaeicoccus suwonensis]|uniref:DNA-binding MarR family transcriptional regulator n=1 Tax=Rudaeicoccus suwonensis TaxID=657409 RepID=A0A561ECR4_9MICO|nr:MarR family winged helix-turn-helix transcriptional regulator [Rudaeicoccus suwonensis]TWE13405.1 DNA-binding MarR family transcriptional regulator [Rudaeicoccus suwonensis]